MVKKQTNEQPVEVPTKEEPQEQLVQRDVIETVGKGTFTLPDGTVKTNH